MATENTEKQKTKKAKRTRPSAISSIGTAISVNEDKAEEAKSELKHKIANGVAELIEIDLIDEIEVFKTKMHNRTAFDKNAILEFAHNLNEIGAKGLLGTGLMQPIIVRKNKNRYERIAGFRRIEAFKVNKSTHIPALIFEDIDDATARFMRNSENAQREANNPYDELVGILEHIALLLNYDEVKKVTSFLYKIGNSKKGKSQMNDEDNELYAQFVDILSRVGRYSLSALTERLIILNFKEVVLKELTENNIGYTEAKLLNKVASEKDIVKLIAFVKTTKPTTKVLNEKIASLKPIEAKKPSKLDEAKSHLTSFKKSAYNSLNSEDKETADSILKEITIKAKMLETLIKKDSQPSS
jgi:ParB family transcriptional regulator, chromosome partitioning protein